MTRRNLLERGVGLWVGASALAGLSTRSVLEAAVRPGPVGAGRDDPGVALPGRRQRRPQHPRPARRPAVPDAAHAARDRAGDDAAGGGPPRVRLAPGPRGPEGACSTRARWPCCRRWTSRTPTSRTSTRPPTGAAGSWGRRFDPTGWLGRTLDVVGVADNPLQGISTSWSPDPVLSVAPRGDRDGLRPERLRLLDRGGVGPRRLQRRLPRTPPRAHGVRGPRAPPGARTRTPSRCATSSCRCGLTTTTRCRPSRSPTRTPTSAAACATWRGCSAPASAPASRRSPSAGSTPTTTSPPSTPSCSPTWATPSSPGRRTSPQRGLAGRVLTLIWSEFGRRPEDNESNGTDHGAGGLVMVVGDRANGGIRSEFPGLVPPRRGRQPARHHRVPHRLRLAAGVVARRGGGARAAQDRRRAPAPRGLSPAA